MGLLPSGGPKPHPTDVPNCGHVQDGREPARTLADEPSPRRDRTPTTSEQPLERPKRRRLLARESLTLPMPRPEKDWLPEAAWPIAAWRSDSRRSRSARNEADR